jgi:hypothetical protein
VNSYEFVGQDRILQAGSKTGLLAAQATRADAIGAQVLDSRQWCNDLCYPSRQLYDLESC